MNEAADVDKRTAGYKRRMLSMQKGTQAMLELLNAESLSTGSSLNICQYIRLKVCIIRFVGSWMWENRTSGSEQGYAP